MRAVVCEEYGDIENLKIKELDDPKAGKGEVVLDVAAAGVNFPDGLTIQGLYQQKPELPFVPGVEVAGVITELGEGVTDSPSPRASPSPDPRALNAVRKASIAASASCKSAKPLSLMSIMLPSEATT